MPWKELSKMDERMRFVARLMEGFTELRLVKSRLGD